MIRWLVYENVISSMSHDRYTLSIAVCLFVCLSIINIMSSSYLGVLGMFDGKIEQLKHTKKPIIENRLIERCMHIYIYIYIIIYVYYIVC